MQYGKILGRALHITWQHKILWLFGLLATLSLPSVRGIANRAELLPSEIRQSLIRLVTGPYFIPFLVGLILLSFAINVVIALVNAAGHSALISLVDRAEKGEAVTAAAGFQAARRRTWRVFLIRFLLWLPVALLITAALMPILIPIFQAIRQGGTRPPDAPTGTDFALFCGGVCLGLLAALVAGLITVLGERACVLEGLPVGKSIARGWHHLTRHLGPALLMGLILAVISIGISLVVITPFYLVILTLIPLAAQGTVQMSTFLLLLLCGGLFFWLVMLGIGSVVNTFNSACWTLFYRRLMLPVPAEEAIS